jgi:hypothetical protein
VNHPNAMTSTIAAQTHTTGRTKRKFSEVYRLEMKKVKIESSANEFIKAKPSGEIDVSGFWAIRPEARRIVAKY